MFSSRAIITLSSFFAHEEIVFKKIILLGLAWKIWGFLAV